MYKYIQIHILIFFNVIYLELKTYQKKNKTHTFRMWKYNVSIYKERKIVSLSSLHTIFFDLSINTILLNFFLEH